MKQAKQSNEAGGVARRDFERGLGFARWEEDCHPVDAAPLFPHPLGGVFGNARLHKLLHESGGKQFVGRKSNRAFSEIISGKLVLVCPDGVNTGIEGAMVLRRAERDQQPRSEAVAGIW